MAHDVEKVPKTRKRGLVKRTGHTFRLTDDEYKSLKPFIEAIKNRTNEQYRMKPLPLDI